MKVSTRLAYTLAAAAVAGTIAGLGTSAPAAAEDVVLRMAVPDWPPTRIMKDLADKFYKGLHPLAELLRAPGGLAHLG
jgi:multiple sugar transport system substrate-binding protein